MSNIKDLLVYAQENFGHITATQDLVTLTEAFPKRPKAYQKAQHIIAYGIGGHPFTTKYRTDKKHPTIKEFGLEQELMATLCVKPIMNTTLHEVADYLKAYPDMHIQGWNTDTLESVHDALRSEYEGFDITTDSAFIFAGDDNVYNKAMLHRHWLMMAIADGPEMLDSWNQVEWTLMKKALPQDLLEGNNIRENSYMYGRDLHTKSSVQFLEAKVSQYLDFPLR